VCYILGSIDSLVLPKATMSRYVFPLLAALLISGSAAAQNYPTKAVRLVVPIPAGQGTDIAARHFADKLSSALGQRFYIENKAGAGGSVGAEAVSRTSADGYTLLMGTSGTHAMNKYLYASIGYDPEKDFEPITLVGMLPMVIAVHPSFAPTTIGELVKAAKAKPDSIGVAVPGPSARLVLQLLIQQADAPLFRVPYESSPKAVLDAMGGHVPVIIDTITATRPHIGSGKLRALAITSLKSSELLPGVRSVAEQGVAGFEYRAWNALFAPRGTSSQIIAILNDQMTKILAQPDTREKLIQLGYEPTSSTPEQLAAFIRSEGDKLGKLVRAANLKAE
jgi:tripartite-type tricarboxylate transporter receptor subunit TctC